jgi:hypothetical protein
MSPNFFHKDRIISLAVIKLCKTNGKKNSGGGGEDRERWGDKRHGYSSYAIAKLLKMKFLIVTLVIKVI